MEFIDFLKYGAIGISLALAILSYRLLSKEQEKDKERPAMLKSIKNYFMLAVVLSIFFGLLEFASQVFINQKTSAASELDLLWKKHFSQYNDSTINQKVNRISVSLVNPKIKTDTAEVCRPLAKRLETLNRKLADYDIGFYENIIKLKNQLKRDPDGWTNLRHGTNFKNEIFYSLKNIFKSLGFNYDNLTNEELIMKWEEYKKAWQSEQLSYVFNSDVTELVKQYLNTFGSS